MGIVYGHFCNLFDCLFDCLFCLFQPFLNLNLPGHDIGQGVRKLIPYGGEIGIPVSYTHKKLQTIHNV